MSPTEMLKPESHLVFLPDKVAPDPLFLEFLGESSKLGEVERKAIMDKLQNELNTDSVSPEHADLCRLTLDFLSGDEFAVPGSIKEAQIRALAANLHRCIQHMERLAGQGEATAIEIYVDFVQERVGTLNDLITKHLPLILPISRKSLSWPARISKRQNAFGDDIKWLIRELQLGNDTVANDKASRFNPNRKFGRLAWELIQRIEVERKAPPLFLYGPNSWKSVARTLPPFNRRATFEEKEKWRAIVKQFLKEEFRGPQRETYRQLIKAPTHRRHWETRLIQKVCDEFDSLWGLHRKG